jgi:hypothetical protein
MMNAVIWNILIIVMNVDICNLYLELNYLTFLSFQSLSGEIKYNGQV